MSHGPKSFPKRLAYNLPTDPGGRIGQFISTDILL